MPSPQRALSRLPAAETVAALFDESGDAMLLVDPEPLVVLDANPVASKLSGLPLEQLRGAAIGDLLQHESGTTDWLHNLRSTHSFHGRAGFLLRTAQADNWVPVSLTISRLHCSASQPLALVSLRDLGEVVAVKRQLERTEQELREVLVSISDCAWSALVQPDGQWRYQYLSPVVEQMTHTPVERFLADSTCMEQLVHVDDLPAYQAFAVEVGAGRSAQAVYRIRITGGEVRWLAETVRAYPGENGQPTRLFGVIANVTDRKQTDDALRESEARYRAVVESGLQGILVHADDLILFVNAAAAEMFGYAGPEELIGRNVFETLVAAEDRPALRSRRDALLRGERLLPLPAWRGVRKDGSQLWASSGGNRIAWQGRTAVVSFFADITERRAAAEAIQQSEQFLQMSQQVGHVGSWAWDLATNHVAWSPEMYRIHGLTTEQFDNSLAGAVGPIHAEDQPVIRGNIEALLAGGEARPMEYRIVRPGGEIRFLWGKGDFLCDASGQRVRMIGTVMDITQRKAAEEEQRRLEARVEQAQKLESLGVLAGGVAHDFNNLLTVVLGYSSLALQELPPESGTSAMLREIEHAALRAAELSRQMLAYSGKGRFVIQALRLDALVQEMTSLLQTVVSKSATLRLDLGPATIEGDATQVRQVVMNLITNAAESLAGEAGHIAIRTGVRHADASFLHSPYLPDDLPAGDYAFVEVEDSGCGMNDDTLARIFDPFFTTKFAGRGLGLAAVLGIVKGHHGTIKVASSPGRGTQFQVFIPCVAAVAVESAPSSAEVLLAPPARGQGTVLVMEDDASVRAFARQVLEAAGFAVLEARDGREGLDHFSQHQGQIVAVVLDLTMPRLDGLEVLAELHRRQSNLPVVVISGFSEQEMSARVAGLGASGCLQKPFQPRDLTERVCHAIGSK